MALSSSLPITEARGMLGEIVNRVTFGGERVRLSRNGKDVAAVVSLEDLEVLQHLEDQADATEADRRMRDANDAPVPFEPER